MPCHRFVSIPAPAKYKCNNWFECSRIGGQFCDQVVKIYIVEDTEEKQYVLMGFENVFVKECSGS